jgi:hypothetical protein
VEAAERAEESMLKGSGPLESRRRGVEQGLPAPTLLVGLGLTPWPGPGVGSQPNRPCPACGSGRLEPSMYCLYCDRWGLDHRLLDGPPPKPATPRHLSFVGGVDRRERDKRKARRRARRLSQAKAGQSPRRNHGARL